MRKICRYFEFKKYSVEGLGFYFFYMTLMRLLTASELRNRKQACSPVFVCQTFRLLKVRSAQGCSLMLVSHPWVFKVWGLRFGHHNADPLEMQKSLSHYACAAKTPAWKTKMLSSIEIIHFVKMQKSLSPYACAAKSLFSAKTSAKKSIGLSRDEW